MKIKLKRGDKVKVITGKSKGTVGEVLKVDREKNRVWVGGANMVKKALKGDPRTGEKGQGWATVEAALPVSNVMLLDSKGNPTRVGYRMDGDNKVRFAKTTGEAI
jgi:large subunit ribosomal protein L24